MERQHIAQLRIQAARYYERSRDLLARVPGTARVALTLFLLAAILMALHTALSSSKDASLRLTLQHGFRSADCSLWIDGDLAYSGKLKGSMKRKLGLIPASVQGNISEILPVSAGTHEIRIRVESEDGSVQQDSLTGSFAENTQREIFVSARSSGLSMVWQASNAPASSGGSAWFARYAGALFFTVAGSIISALTGFALKELPSHLRMRDNAEPKPQGRSADQ